MHPLRSLLTERAHERFAGLHRAARGAGFLSYNREHCNGVAFVQGNVEWTRSFPTDDAHPNAVAASAADGTIAVVSASAARLVVRRLDGAGNLKQQREFIATGAIGVEAVTIAPDGALAVVGYGAPLQLGPFNTEGARFLATLNADDTPRSMVRFAEAHDRVWLDSSRIVRISGGYRRLTVHDHALVERASIDLNATSAAVSFAADGGLRVAYTKADTLRFASVTTTLEELRWLGTRGVITVDALTVTADDIIAAGTVTGAIDGVEGHGVFVAGRFVRVIDGAEHAIAIVARDAGSITVGGLASDPIDAGGATLGQPHCERDQSFIVTLDATGAITSSAGLAGAVALRSLVLSGGRAIAVASADAPLGTVDATPSAPSLGLASFR